MTYLAAECLIPPGEHYGPEVECKAILHATKEDLKRERLLDSTAANARGTPFDPGAQCTANRLRTPPLWGLHVRSRFMHDGQSVQLHDAIMRHEGEAKAFSQAFDRLREEEKEALIIFLLSL